MVLLKTSDASGTAFVRTDQLDGETDWKLRVAVPTFQKMEEQDLLKVEGEVYGKLAPLLALPASRISAKSTIHFFSSS
jgi:magnesium-transporting ATPase (P-type)